MEEIQNMTAKSKEKREQGNKREIKVQREKVKKSSRKMGNKSSKRKPKKNPNKNLKKQIGWEKKIIPKTAM